MRLKIVNNLQGKKWYWKTRRWLTNGPAFVFWKKLFAFLYWFDDEKTSFRLLRGNIGSMVEGLLYAIVAVLVFEHLNNIAPAPEVANILQIGSLPSLDRQAIDALLTTVASISGVFLALYFASISSVVGNLLMSAPDQVRKLYLEEKEGAQYIRTLVLTGVISVFYLVFKSAGYEVSLYSLAFLLLLTIYNIAAFRRLGMQLFFLRSSEGAANITGEISKSIRGATEFWKNKNKPVLQNHFSTRVSLYLDTFRQLIDFGSEKDLFSLEQMKQFARYAGGLLVFYPEQKRKILTNSLWFKTKRQHKKWILTDSTEIALALHSGTGLSPTEIRDHIWFERAVATILKVLQEYFLARKDADSIVIGTEIYVQIFEYGLANNLSTEEAVLFIEQLKGVQEDVYKSDLSKKELTMIIDSDGRVAIGSLLGFVRYIDQLKPEKIEKIFSKEKIGWGNIYDGTIPQAMLHRAEELRSNLRNEEVIEGNTDTPDWYIKTMLVYNLLILIKKYFEHIKSLHNTYYHQRIDAFIAAGEIMIASQLLQRWLEFCSKYQMCVSLVSKTFESLADHNKQHDFEWPSFILETEQAEADAFQQSAIDKMTKLLPELGVNPITDQDTPDYFGQAFTFGVEACYQACEDNDVNRLKQIFPSVFIGSIVAFNTTRDDTKGWPEQSQIVFSSEPLTDLIEISGYAKLYSELYGNPTLWNACQGVWDRYLNQEESEQIVRIIVSTTAYRKTLFMIMPKGILRANWEIGFRRKLAERGLISEVDMFRGRDRNRGIHHASKLIRILASRGILPVDPEDIFFITYLKRHPRSRDIDFPANRNRIEELLEEEEEAEESQDDAPEEPHAEN